jgi:hypothetical protein
LFALGFLLLAFAMGFCFWLLSFWMKGGFLMWEALERKRIAEEKGFLKGKGLLKENC